ncbi:MAG: glycosyltransferase family 39 protein [Candidatus Saganbacteria bacterium]|nr:glycosyltransferase family 39 protein [Candidatus Saganbacteria bacterium]
MYFWLFLAVINLFKLWLGRYLPLLGDEAYYNLWAQKLAMSYVDHPPAIAYIHWFLNSIFGRTEFAVRFGAILMILLATWLVYLVARTAYNKKIAVYAAVLFNLIPTYFLGGLFLTPELPLVIFWLLSLLFLLKLIETERGYYWYLIGLAAGLGLLSKFPMLLFFPGILLFLSLSNYNRRWLKRPEPYIGLAIALLLSSPVLIWNIQHGFPSLSHHGARLGSPNYLSNVFSFLLLQFFMYSPPLFIFSAATCVYGFWRTYKKMNDYSLALLALPIPAFLAFLLVSPFTQVGGHWTSIVYLSLLIVLTQRWTSFYPKGLGERRLWGNLSVILLINILFISYYAFLYPIPKEFNGQAYKINRQLAQYIKEIGPDYVYSNQMGVASLVAFYGKTEVYLPQGRWPQFDIWGRPELKAGDDVLYFAFNDPEKGAWLKQRFVEVKSDRHKRLFTKDSDIPLKVEVYICRNYQGGPLP